MAKRKKVKVDRYKRKLLHELFTPTVMWPLNQATTKLDWYLRTQKEGLTPGERKYLRDLHAEMSTISGKLLKIFFRLKY